VAFLARAAAIFPDRVAVIHGRRRMTYGTLDARCRRLASALRATAAERPAAGAVWADANCPPCGMAAVSPLCERFLDFFAQPRQ
jgi:fatty-acyl-CoA synthase